MRDLLVTTHTPVLRSGQAVRTYGVARALSDHRPLTLLYATFGASEPDRAFREIPGIELRAVLPSRGARRLAAFGRARLAGVPQGFARGVSPELAGEAARLAGEPDRGRVIADGPVAAAALAQLARARPVIYNAHNLESSFRFELGGEPGPGALRRFERGLLGRASESWMVSEAEIASARELCPQARLRYVPNVVDVASIAAVQPAADSQRALFVANFAYQPNRDGLRFLLEEVFPRVWKELPGARLTLVGAGLERPAAEDPRVEMLGFIEDLGGAYERAACAVVPLLQGGGTPLKFVEALAFGLPVIATSRAAAGLAVQDGLHCILADGGEAFALALAQVLRDGAPGLGRAGRRLAEERYSVQALSRLLDPQP